MPMPPQARPDAVWEWPGFNYLNDMLMTCQCPPGAPWCRVRVTRLCQTWARRQPGGEQTAGLTGCTWTWATHRLLRPPPQAPGRQAPVQAPVQAPAGSSWWSWWQTHGPCPRQRSGSSDICLQDARGPSRGDGSLSAGLLVTCLIFDELPVTFKHRHLCWLLP